MMRARIAFAFALAFALLGAGAIWTLTGPERFSNDTAQYMSVADNLLDSGRLATTIVMYEVQHKQGMPAAQTVWPPGYPAFIALAAKALGVDPAVAIEILNALCHALGVLMLFATLRRVGASGWVAALVAATWAVYFVPINLAVAGTSEAIYVLFVVSMAYALARGLGPPLNSGWLVAAGVALALAYSIRYQALAYGPALGLAVLVAARRQGRSWVNAFVQGTICVAPFAVTFLAVSGRNIQLAGTISGLWMPDRAAGPAGEALRGLAQAAGYLAWPLAGGVKQALSESLGLALLVVAALVLILFGVATAVRSALSRRAARDEAREARLGVAILTVGGVVVTLGLLLHLILHTSAAAIEARYFGVLIPAVMIAVGCVLAQADASGDGSRPAPRWPHAAFICGLALFGLVTLSQWSNRLALPSQAEEIRRILEGTNVGNETLAARVRREASIASPVLSNQSQLAYHVIRKPMLGVPIRRLSIAPEWKPEDIRELARRFGTRYVLVFRAATAGGEGPTNDFLVMMDKAKPAWLTPVYEDDKVALLRID